MLFAVLGTHCPICIHYVIFGLGSSISGSLLLFACLHVLFEPAEPPHVAKESILYLKFKHLLLCTIQRGLLFRHGRVYFPSLNSRYISSCFPLISGYCPQASSKQRPLTSSWMFFPLSVSLIPSGSTTKVEMAAALRFTVHEQEPVALLLWSLSAPSLSWFLRAYSVAGTTRSKQNIDKAFSCSLQQGSPYGPVPSLSLPPGNNNPPHPTTH